MKRPIGLRRKAPVPCPHTSGRKRRQRKLAATRGSNPQTGYHPPEHQLRLPCPHHSGGRESAVGRPSCQGEPVGIFLVQLLFQIGVRRSPEVERFLVVPARELDGGRGALEVEDGEV